MKKEILKNEKTYERSGVLISFFCIILIWADEMK